LDRRRSDGRPCVASKKQARARLSAVSGPPAITGTTWST
jgi:hypothetical protein